VEKTMLLKDKFATAAFPVIRLLGHSLATAIGFCGLALISLIPIGVVKVLIWLGIRQLVELLHALETLLLVIDVGLFGVIFLTGVAVFVVEVLASTKRQINAAWRNSRE
jgi:hypothetical protein